MMYVNVYALSIGIDSFVPLCILGLDLPMPIGIHSAIPLHNIYSIFDH
jgi:hypothetical protein